MMSKEKQIELHKAAIGKAGLELRDVLEGSGQAVYIYACDAHKVCNKNFASLLGYSTPEEWAATDVPFVETFVAQSSQDRLVDAYWRAMTEKVGSKVQVAWRRRDGGEVVTDVIIVPIALEGQDLALHFVSLRRP